MEPTHILFVAVLLTMAFTPAYAHSETELLDIINSIFTEFFNDIRNAMFGLEERVAHLESRLDVIEGTRTCDTLRRQAATHPPHIGTEPHIPEWVRDFTECYTGGEFSTDEFKTIVQQLIQKDIIYLGEPRLDDAALIYGKVTRNVDGNTIHIDDVNIRIPLVDVQDSGNHTMPHAVLAKLLCPVGSPAMYDIDDEQKQDQYGRTIAVVYCNTELSLGEVMIGFGLGWINDYYCDKSEFEFADWTHGSCW